MSLIQSITSWFIKGTDKTAETYTFGPFNAEVLNGSQFYLKYTNAVNTTVNVRLSAAEAHGNDMAGVDPFSIPKLYDTVEAKAIGDNSDLGFFAAPTEMNSPFKSMEIDLVVAGAITGVYFGLCANGIGGG